MGKSVQGRGLHHAGALPGQQNRMQALRHSLCSEGGARWRSGSPPFGGHRTSTEKIPHPPCWKSWAMASCASPMANRRMRVRWPAVRGADGSCTAEARRPWSAVCSHSSTGDRRRGAQRTPGGGSRNSACRLTAPCAAWQRSGTQKMHDAPCRTTGVRQEVWHSPCTQPPSTKTPCGSSLGGQGDRPLAIDQGSPVQAVSGSASRSFSPGELARKTRRGTAVR
jgi:hypothetical protein